MPQEWIEFISSIAFMVLGDLDYIFSMLLVVIVAACFLGRYIVLSKKLVLSTLSLIGVTVIGTVAINAVLASMGYTDKVDIDTNMFINSIFNAAIFVYSLIFYFFAFKEKRILRAIESAICLYLVRLYLSTFSQMAVVYFAGGTFEIFRVVYLDDFGYGKYWTAISITNFAITLALLLIAYFGFYRPKKYYIISIPARILFIVWAVLFVVFPFIPAAMDSADTTLELRYGVMSVIYAAMLVILGLAAPVLLVIFSAERSMLEKNRSQEAYLAAELEYIGQYKKKQVETNRFRHDIKNNLALTQMMLDEGHVEEAREHLKDMLGKVSSLSPKYVTGDEMLDIIISMKADKMDELNIRFTLDGVADGGLQIKPMDMCSIFANALDNAIEAASSCKEPFISFAIKRTDKFFVIKISNSAEKKIDIGKLLSTSGYTSKSDKDHHGFGLMNVRRAVEDYNGILKAESDEKSFTLSILMPRT